jgi:hypothetical protein
MKLIFGAVTICGECANKILLAYVEGSAINMLCPFCYGREGNAQSCKYCDIGSPEEGFSDNA